MKKLAIFVEGVTEQILVRKMLEVVLDRRKIAIQTVKITGGHNVRMSFTVMTAANVTRQTDYFVMIYDCGGETNVKSYIQSQRDSLIRGGYQRILGLRDVYPNFERDEIKKLKYGLNFKLQQRGAKTKICIAVMETEAWFLGEYKHLKKVNVKLTPGYINKRLGFNPRTQNMEERDHPSADMKAAYQLVGHDYTKKRDRLNAVVRKLDFKHFTHGLSTKMPSLGTFVEGLQKFFQEDF